MQRADRIQRRIDPTPTATSHIGDSAPSYSRIYTWRPIASAELQVRLVGTRERYAVQTLEGLELGQVWRDENADWGNCWRYSPSKELVKPAHPSVPLQAMFNGGVSALLAHLRRLGRV